MIELLVIAVAAATGLVLGVALAVRDVGRRARRRRALLPPRRTAVPGTGLEAQQPGQPGDAVGSCLHCPWSASSPTVLGAHADLTEHVRRAHGGIA